MDYVASDYQHGERLLLALGSFWYTIFDDADMLKTHYRGQALEAAQAYQSYLESVASLSRYEVPVFHRDNWFYLSFRESELDTDLLRYGDGGTYGGGFQYGVRYQTSQHAANIPDRLRRAPLAFNRILDPSLTWTQGVDYVVDTDRGRILFKENPFEQEISVQDEFDGVTLERTGGLWLYAAEFDLQHVWTHFGYALGVYMESSEYYKDFIAAYGDAHTFGPSLDIVHRMLVALTGVPLVREVKEVVLDIQAASDHKLIITDKHAYRVPPTSNITVSALETVYGGQALTHAVEVVELDAKTPISVETLPALAMGPNLIAGGYTGEIIFNNEEVLWTYEGEDGGKAVLQFKVGGFSEDVREFWGRVHRSGLSAGKVLAEYLAGVAPPTQPLPGPTSSGGRTVNPLQFILQLMGNNLFVIKIRPMELAAKAPGTRYLEYIRQILPPHTSYVVYLELTPNTDEIDLESGYTEQQELFTVAVIEDTMDTGTVADVVMVRLVPDKCKNE